MPAKLSTRISIQWLPEEASEPTDTLVMTVGSYYLDLRILKDDTSKIDWSMAGEVVTLSEEPCQRNFPLFLHFVLFYLEYCYSYAL
jgi:hypothetical protein